MKYSDLTENQQEEFASLFYEIVCFDDTMLASPWGCPWYWCKDTIAPCLTVKERVHLFIEKYGDDMLESLKEDEEETK